MIQTIITHLLWTVSPVDLEMLLFVVLCFVAI